MFQWIKRLFSKADVLPEPETDSTIEHGRIDSPGNTITGENNPLLHKLLTEAMKSPGKMMIMNETDEDIWKVDKVKIK